MQLEAKMKQRFSWMVLLLLTACLVHSSMADDPKPPPACESGFVGTFKQPDQTDPTTYESLTITPIHNVSLEVPIEKTDKDDTGIQIYLLLDQDGECNQDFTIKFDITSPDGKTACPFDVKVNKDKLEFDGNSLQFDYADPYQGSFEVRDDQAIVQTSNGEERSKSAAKCLKTDNGKTSFTLKFDKPVKKAGQECGVQFEMKGNYQVIDSVITVDKTDKHDGKCKVDLPGTSNDDHGEGTPTPSDQAPTTAAPFLWWYWLLIVLGIVLLVVVVPAIVLIIVCCVCLKKKKSADEDLEAAPEDESDIQPAEQSTVVTDVKVTAIAAGAEPESGVDPTQQNASQNADDKPDDDDDD